MKTHKNLLQKTAIPSLLIAASMAFFLPGCAEEQYNKDQEVAMAEEPAEPTREEQLIMDLQDALDEIQSNLALVRETEQRLEGSDSYSDATEDKKEQIVKEIQMMNTLLAMDRETISSLEAKLKAAGSKNTKLNSQMAGLTKQLGELNEQVTLQEDRIGELVATLESRDLDIAQLSAVLDSMAFQMVVRDSKIANLNDSITANLDEANKVYLAQDSRHNLIEHGVITKEGSFLGIGGQPEIAANPEEGQFIEIDKRKVTTIPVYAKRVEFITPHPADSYEIVETNDKKVASIEIKNPEEFWKTSPYLVLAVK